MSVDMYKTRNMLDVLKQIHIPGDFLLKTFVTAKKFHSTRTVDIDIVRMGKKMAPFVSPVVEGKVITKKGFTTKTHTLPYIKIKRPFSPEDALERLPGLTMYESQTAQAYIAKELGETLKEFDDMIFRREEYMAATMLQTGKVIVEGDGLSYEIDVGMAASHLPVLLTTDRWSEATATIQADLKAWGLKVYRDSGLTATRAILGSDAAAAMLSNDAFIGSLDTRRVDRGLIDISKLDKGVIYYGFDKESGLDLYGYNEQFFEEDDTDASDGTELIDPKKVIVASTQLRMTQHYGLISEVKVNFVGPRYPKVWVTEDPSVQWIMLQSSPAVINHQPDGVVCATVMS